MTDPKAESESEPETKADPQREKLERAAGYWQAFTHAMATRGAQFELGERHGRQRWDCTVGRTTARGRTSPEVALHSALMLEFDGNVPESFGLPKSTVTPLVPSAAPKAESKAVADEREAGGNGCTPPLPQETPVAEIVECQTMGQQTVREIDGQWKFLPYGTKLYADRVLSSGRVNRHTGMWEGSETYPEEDEVSLLIKDRAEPQAIRDLVARIVIERDEARASLATPQPTQPAGLSEDEEPSAKQRKLMELADRIDYERLCLRAGLDHKHFTQEQKDRMNAGVELRRYARIWKSDHWVITPPTGPVRFCSTTLDGAYKMAKKDEDRQSALGAAQKEERA